METEDLEETVRKSKEMLNDEFARTKGKGKSSVKDREAGQGTDRTVRLPSPGLL
jgi:hypothetical protein